MGDAPRWILGLAGRIDGFLRDVSRKLKRTLRLLRFVVAFLVLLDLALLAAGVFVLFRPEYVHYVAALAMFALFVQLLVLTIIVALPLRLKSVVRLIDKGYPGNARELALRAMARKFRDESIETEELLAEAAWNESKKLLRKYQDAARAARAEAATAEAAQAAQAAQAAEAMADAARDTARRDGRI